MAGDIVIASPLDATTGGVIGVLVALPGTMAATLIGSVTAEAGTPIGPADIQIATTIAAIMAGRIVFEEQLGVDRGGPQLIRGPLLFPRLWDEDPFGDEFPFRVPVPYRGRRAPSAGAALARLPRRRTRRR